MSFLPRPIVCDVCKSQRKDVNHWFYSVVPVAMEAFLIYPWDSLAEDTKRVDIVHLCGHVCAVKKLSEWLDSCATPVNRDSVS